MSDDFSKLKVGDEVAVWCYGGFSGRWETAIVEKVLSKWIVAGGIKYRIDTGRAVDEYRRQSLKLLTAETKRDMAEHAERDRVANRRRALSEWSTWREADAATVNAAWAIVEKMRAAAGGTDGQA